MLILTNFTRILATTVIVYLPVFMAMLYQPSLTNELSMNTHGRCRLTNKCSYTDDPILYNNLVT